MVKFSSFLIFSTIIVSSYSPLLAMEDEELEYLPLSTSRSPAVVSISSSPTASEPSWIYKAGETDILVCSTLQANLIDASSSQELSDVDKKALMSVKGMDAERNVEFIMDLETYLKTSMNESHKAYVRDVVKSIVMGDFLESSDYKSLNPSYRLNFLKALSNPLYDDEQQVRAFKALQVLLQEEQRQDPRKRSTFGGDKRVKYTVDATVFQLVKNVYETLPDAMLKNSTRLTDILALLRNQQDLKDFSGIELLGAFLMIRDGSLEQDDQ